MTEKTDLLAYRVYEKRDDGSYLGYSVPAGVPKEVVEAEVKAMARAVDRGYYRPMRFRDRPYKYPTFHKFLNLWDKVLFWFKCRWLDVYWGVRDYYDRCRKGNEG